jgi:tripartite-type tricarboxylate transporter receptor subunit TctC
MHALAVTSARRSPALPDVPTVSEAGLKGAEVDTMIGIVGPAKLPPTMIARIYADVQEVLKRPDIRVTFDRQGGEPAVGVTTAAYAEKWRNEYLRYQKLLPEIGLKPQ